MTTLKGLAPVSAQKPELAPIPLHFGVRVPCLVVSGPEYEEIPWACVDEAGPIESRLKAHV